MECSCILYINNILFIYIYIYHVFNYISIYKDAALISFVPLRSEFVKLKEIRNSRVNL